MINPWSLSLVGLRIYKSCLFHIVWFDFNQSTRGIKPITFIQFIRNKWDLIFQVFPWSRLLNPCRIMVTIWEVPLYKEWKQKFAHTLLVIRGHAWPGHRFLQFFLTLCWKIPLLPGFLRRRLRVIHSFRIWVYKFVFIVQSNNIISHLHSCRSLSIHSHLRVSQRASCSHCGKVLTFSGKVEFGRNGFLF